MLTVHVTAQNDIPEPGSLIQLVRQFLHRPRYLTVMKLDEFAAAGSNILRFVPEKTGGLDALHQTGRVSVGTIFCRPILFEQVSRDEVDALICALRRENRGNEQFERAGVIQLAMRVGIRPLQTN